MIDGKQPLQAARRSKPKALAAWSAVCSCAVALTLPMSLASAREAKPARTASTCASSGLVLWLDTQGNGSAGSSYYKLELTNLSGRTCTLAGFPRVSAVGLGGRQLGSSARREGSAGKSVTLAGGATAMAMLRIVEAGNYPASKCGRVTAAGLRVHPSGQGSAKTIPFPFEACSRSGPAYLAIGPVKNG
ncbi:MAG: DUF4232 domain-containing protein [Solirubrobacteraceae bacterium]